MRLSSFKARIFFISILVSVLIVGFIRVTTYFVMAERMNEVARQEAAEVAASALADVRRDAEMAFEGTPAATATPGAAARAVKEFVDTVAAEFSETAGGLRAGYAFYDERGRMRYASKRAVAGSDTRGRARAARTGRAVESHVGGASAIHNLILPADVGFYVVHTPFRLPDGTRWVLDTVYEPTREARTMDALRSPMIELGILSTLLTVVAMVGTTLWVLRLIDELRVAADSIDAGHLDVRMPERGRNEISDLGRSVNALVERLRRAGQAQTRFVADASHELATPVAGIRGHINILRSWGASDPDVATESLDAIDRESRRMVRLTRQLLEMIRSEGQLSYAPALKDVNAIARRVLADAATRYAGKGLEFEGPEAATLTVWVDPDRVEQVLGILVDNAAKYTPGGGHVKVATEARRREAVLTVTDSGIGIPADDLPSIFERFYRADPSRTSDGFGLGLSIAKKIVETAGGSIGAESEPGVGTVFTIRLPDRPR